MKSLFTFLPIPTPTQVISDDEVHGVHVTFAEPASSILDIYEPQYKDLDLTTNMGELGRRMDVLSDARLVNHQVFSSQLLHTNRHFDIMEHEKARLRHELSTYQQGMYPLARERGSGSTGSFRA